MDICADLSAPDMGSTHSASDKITSLMNPHRQRFHIAMCKAWTNHNHSWGQTTKNEYFCRFTDACNQSEWLHIKLSFLYNLQLCHVTARHCSLFFRFYFCHIQLFPHGNRALQRSLADRSTLVEVCVQQQSGESRWGTLFKIPQWLGCAAKNGFPSIEQIYSCSCVSCSK